MMPLPRFLRVVGALFLWMQASAADSTTMADLPTTFPTTPTPFQIPHGYARFHANDSHIGRPVPCSHDEKVCFRYNMIFHPQTDKCQPLNEGGHQCFLTADRNEFENGSGHISGVCRKYTDPCKYWIGVRMAYDGHCYDKDIIKDICGCDLQPTPHFLGGSECRCTGTEYVDVEQPEEEGRCRIPDFRNPLPNRHIFYDMPLPTMERRGVRLDCSPEQQRCFQEGKVWLEGANGCHNLLKQGPCPEDHVVVVDARGLVKGLDPRATLQGRMETTCMHVRGGCPPGQKRMAFDLKCYEDRDIAIAAPGAVLMNAYGVHEVLVYAISVLYTPQLKDEKCEVQFLQVWPPLNIVDIPDAICNTEKDPSCSFTKVFPAPPRYE